MSEIEQERIDAPQIVVFNKLLMQQLLGGAQADDIRLITLTTHAGMQYAKWKNPEFKKLIEVLWGQNYSIVTAFQGSHQGKDFRKVTWDWKLISTEDGYKRWFAPFDSGHFESNENTEGLTKREKFVKATGNLTPAGYSNLSTTFAHYAIPETMKIFKHVALKIDARAAAEVLGRTGSG